MRKLWIILTLILFCSAEVFSLRADSSTLTIGIISEDPRVEIPSLMKIAKFIQKQMAGTSISQVSLYTPETPAELTDALKSKKLDWITASSARGLLYASQARSEIVLSRWKWGVSECQTLFIVRSDQPGARIKDLKNKKIALTNTQSSFGYLIPLALLRESGLDPVRLGNPRDPVPTGKVGYVLSGSAINSCVWLDQQYVDVAAISDLDWNREKIVPVEKKKGFRVLFQSGKFPQWVEVFRKDLSPEVKESVINILAQASKTSAGKKVLRNWEQTIRIERLNLGTQGELKELARLLKFIRKDEVDK